MDVSEIHVYGPDGLAPHQGGEIHDNVSFFFFQDPDGNGWAVQQISTRRWDCAE